MVANGWISKLSFTNRYIRDVFEPVAEIQAYDEQKLHTWTILFIEDQYATQKKRQGCNHTRVAYEQYLDENIIVPAEQR